MDDVPAAGKQRVAVRGDAERPRRHLGAVVVAADVARHPRGADEPRRRGIRHVEYLRVVPGGDVGAAAARSRREWRCRRPRARPSTRGDPRSETSHDEQAATPPRRTACCRRPRGRAPALRSDASDDRRPRRIADVDSRQAPRAVRDESRRAAHADAPRVVQTRMPCRSGLNPFTASRR